MVDIKEDIHWINGFLDSLLNSDNISNQQVKILKDKFSSLIIKMEQNNRSNTDEELIELLKSRRNSKSITQIKNKTDKLNEPIDDLPF